MKCWVRVSPLPVAYNSMETHMLIRADIHIRHTVIIAIRYLGVGSMVNNVTAFPFSDIAVCIHTRGFIRCIPILLLLYIYPSHCLLGFDYCVLYTYVYHVCTECTHPQMHKTMSSCQNCRSRVLVCGF